jgi:hypothetical protein
VHARTLCKSLWVKLKMSERVCLCGCECVWSCSPVLTKIYLKKNSSFVPLADFVVTRRRHPPCLLSLCRRATCSLTPLPVCSLRCLLLCKRRLCFAFLLFCCFFNQHTFVQC